MRHLYRLLFVLASASFFYAPAQAQNPGTVSNHALPIGKGPGVSGYGSVGPCTSGYFIGGTGASTDPSCQGFTQSGTGAVTRTWADKLTEVVSPLDFGAIAGDNTKYVVNQTAFQRALATGKAVRCPSGSIFYTQAITIPTNAVGIEGGCALVAAGSYSAPALGVLYGSGNTNLTIRNITVNGTPLSVDAIRTVSNVNLVIDNVVVQGANALHDTSSTGTIIKNSQVQTYSNIGIISSSGVHTKILNNYVANSPGLSINNPPFFCIQANIGSPGDPGSDVLIQGNTTVNCGNGFGINVNGNDPTQYEGVIIDGNKVYNTIVEGINVAGVKNFVISNNYASFGATHVEQGIDTWGPSATLRADNGTITGNTVVNACAGGIAMDQYSSNVSITGNTIVNANTCQSSAGNANAAIVLWNTTKTGVFGNTIVDPNNYIKWQVNEFNDGTTAQTPNFNTIGENAGPNGSLGRYNIIGANSTVGERCVYKLGSGVCNGDPTTQAVTFGSIASNAGITANQSVNGNEIVSSTNTNAGSSAVAVIGATSNAGSVSMQANSTAGGGGASVVTSLPFTVGSTGTTSLGTAGTVSISSAGVLSVSAGSFAFVTPPQGRLTLQANTPVMTTSQSAQTTLRYSAYVGNLVPYYNGTTDVLDAIASNEVTDAMVSAASAGQVVSGQVYDVWWVHSGANRICLAMSSSSGAGGGWASDTAGSNTARGTGYSQIDRVTRSYPTNKNSITNCFNAATNYGPVSANQGTYLGTVFSTGNGQVSYTLGSAASGGGAAVLGVWNMHNRVMTATSVIDNGATYTYSSATIRQARGSTSNGIQFVIGLQEDGVQWSYAAEAISAASGANMATGVGFDVTNALSTQRAIFVASASGLRDARPNSGVWQVGVGVHTLAAVEQSDGTNANTFDGSSLNVLSAALRN